MSQLDIPSSGQDDLYSQLVSSLPDSLRRVEDLAKTSLVTVYTPLLPPILSKQDIITCLQKFTRVCDGFEQKLACITLLTDYVVSAIMYPTMVDIFALDTSNRSKKFIMEIVSREWEALFIAIIMTVPDTRPRKEAMESALTFLRRMVSLLNIFDQSLSDLLHSSVSNNCFWSFGLQTVDGREAPVKLGSRENIKVKKCESKEMDEFVNQDLAAGGTFGPSVAAFPIQHSVVPTTMSSTTSSATSSTSNSVKVGVSRLHVASLQLKCGVEQQINCQVETAGVVLSITTRCGNCAKVRMGGREVESAVLALTGEQLLFLYLTVPGCLAVQTSLERLPGMSVPPLALLGVENRRMVVCIKKMGKEEGERLTFVLQVVMGERLAVVDQSFAKRLLAKKENHSKLFTVAGKKCGGGKQQPRTGDRRAGEVRLSVERKIDYSLNYWTDPAVLLSTTNTYLQKLKPLLPVPTVQYQDCPLDLSCSTSTLLASQTSAPLPGSTTAPLPGSTTAPLPGSTTAPLPGTTAKCNCNPSMQESCKFCKPAKSVSQPAVGRGALQGLDIAVILADSKEEFLKVNLLTVQRKLPGEKALQAKYLEMKWNELTAVMSKKEEDDQSRPVKRPKINIIKNLTNNPLELSANIQLPEPSTSPDSVINPLTSSSLSPTMATYHPPPLPSIATVLADQEAQPPGQCQCDDCLYVTKSHMERSKLAKIKCRCHPCELRDKQTAKMGSKPWDLVTIGNYEGAVGNYWLEPWIEDLFKDIKQKKISVKQAAELTGTKYNQLYKHYRDRMGR
eukprot:GFUD01022390.1.p1 GENE.GFUD01022390.1~~GFUD01022390.1.p1  ORF type:complete len:789 (+),score=259.32 GFUD01022390.1:43-2409(+)